MKPSRSWAIRFLILLLVFLPASLAAISVYDVIRLSQGRYSDEEIIRLIETTDSRFVLSTEDTVRLRNAGVTESVIREILSTGRISTSCSQRLGLFAFTRCLTISFSRR